MSQAFSGIKGLKQKKKKFPSPWQMVTLFETYPT